MTHRVNITLDDNAWVTLQGFPKGQRSKLISKAIISTAKTEQMSKAAAKMDALRNKIKGKFSTEEIVSWIRKDRNRNK